jgi:hypothetical protein
MKFKTRVLLAIGGILNIACGIANAEPRTGDLLGTKYQIIESVTEDPRLCRQARDSLNQPTIFNGNDLAASLLTPDAAMMWQVFDGAAGGYRPIRTVGEFRNHANRTNRLELDLNGDGIAEQITREWLEIKAQTYTSLSIGADGESRPITYQTLRAALGDARANYLDSSFFLFEIVEFDERPFVVALATIVSGTERSDRFTFVLHMNATMQPEVDCILKTVIYGH